MDATLVVDSLSRPHCPRKQMGRDDQDAPRKDWQLDQEPLELNHEEKKWRDDGDPLRYF